MQATSAHSRKPVATSGRRCVLPSCQSCGALATASGGRGRSSRCMAGGGQQGRWVRGATHRSLRTEPTWRLPGAAHAGGRRRRRRRRLSASSDCSAAGSGSCLTTQRPRRFWSVAFDIQGGARCWLPAAAGWAQRATTRRRQRPSRRSSSWDTRRGRRLCAHRPCFWRGRCVWCLLFLPVRRIWRLPIW